MHIKKYIPNKDTKMTESKGLLSYLKLRMNIDYPAYEEIYLFGYDCAKARLGDDENPYKKGTKQYHQWLEGWWAGFYQEEPLFSVDSSGSRPEA